MLAPAASYSEIIREFRWLIPSRFNIGVACADSWAKAEPDRVALMRYETGGSIETISYGVLRAESNRLAQALRARGIKRGDRVAILLPQSLETVLGHLATYKLGAIAVPLAALFGSEALSYRLRMSGAKAILTNAAGLGKLAEISGDLPELEVIASSDGPDGGAEGFWQLLEPFDKDFVAEDTSPDDPALMIFTSGTTGPPKGALHAHRVLLGHLPGIAFSHEFMPRPGDRMWTPSDWAWAGGLLNVLLPSLYFGVPVVFGPFQRFDAEGALTLMAEAGVRNAFLPPTAIRMLRGVANPIERYELKLRTIGAAGESLGGDTYEWSKSALGITVNEFYGQTECNCVLGSCAAIGVSRAGATGMPVPGHRVAILDDEGHELPAETLGQIAVKRPDPVMFLEYWRQPEATAEKFVGDWMITGDQGIMDEEGYFRFVGRDDDVIISAGYRIGPTEIEDCLTGHPAVALSAAIGKPDPLRTEIVKAFIQLRPGYIASETLAEDIKHFVRTRLSAAEYPRELAFVDEIPLTTTGKVIRRIFREKIMEETEVSSSDQER
jgi:acetyl-CoA synthetase